MMSKIQLISCAIITLTSECLSRRSRRTCTVDTTAPYTSDMSTSWSVGSVRSYSVLSVLSWLDLVTQVGRESKCSKVPLILDYINAACSAEFHKYLYMFLFSLMHRWCHGLNCINTWHGTSVVHFVLTLSIPRYHVGHNCKLAILNSQFKIMKSPITTHSHDSHIHCLSPDLHLMIEMLACENAGQQCDMWLHVSMTSDSVNVIKTTLSLVKSQ